MTRPTVLGGSVMYVLWNCVLLCACILGWLYQVVVSVVFLVTGCILKVRGDCQTREIAFAWQWGFLGAGIPKDFSKLLLCPIRIYSFCISALSISICTSSNFMNSYMRWKLCEIAHCQLLSARDFLAPYGRDGWFLSLFSLPPFLRTKYLTKGLGKVVVIKIYRTRKN